MKKTSIFIIGILVGAALMTTTSVFADDLKRLVNSKVGNVWELYVDNELVGEVPIIQNSSYAPVRQIAEIAGMGVDFEPGKVFLTSEEAGEIIKDEAYVSSRVNFLNTRIEQFELSKREYSETLSTLTNDETERRKNLEKTIAEIEVKIAEYKAEIAELSKES